MYGRRIVLAVKTCALKSKFYEEVGDHPLQEYPRPQLERDSYINLNGYWNYAIRKKRQDLGTFD